VNLSFIWDSLLIYGDSMSRVVRFMRAVYLSYGLYIYSFSERFKHFKLIVGVINLFYRGLWLLFPDRSIRRMLGFTG
jgi:hypothetical protein